MAILTATGSVAILLNNGNGFAPPVTYAAANTIGAMAIADVNQDGNQDVVVVDGSALVYVLYGNGDGTLQPAITIHLPASALDVVVGDFNGDGIPDLAVGACNVCSRGLGSILILPGQGHGVFGAPISTTTRYGVAALVAGDFNNDGKLDLAFDLQLPEGYKIYALATMLGNGDGTFQASQSVLRNGSSTHLLVHDLNGDGIEDIVDGGEILFGKGDGTFQPPVTYPSEGNPEWTALADVNGDGIIDILSANGTGSVSISLGAGHGVFQTPYSYIDGYEPRWIGVADFLGHGYQDIVTIAGKYLDLLPGAPGGKYQAQPTIDLNQSAIGNPVLADFNGDGNLDAAVLSYGSSVSILLGKGNGGFTAIAPAVAGPAPNALIPGDFNGDGKTDLAIADSQTNLIYILIGKGDGTFTAGATYPVTQVTGCSGAGTCYYLAAADLNHDSKLDLVVLGGNPNVTGSAVAQAFLGKGDGTFGAPITIASGLEARLFAAGDFNGDGNPDLVISNVQNGPELFLGAGNGTFQEPVPLYTEGPSSIAAGDFNGDGILDLAFTNPQSESIVLLGYGNGTFRQSQAIAQYAGGLPIVADLNGDGHPDIFAPTSGRNIFALYLGKGDGTFIRQTGAAISCVSFNACGAAVGDVNGDGKVDIFSIQIGNDYISTPIAVLINTTR